MAAYYAWEAGADAVYVGLRRFSARGSAQNFSLPELAKLKTLSQARNGKVYVAFNTVVSDEEIDHVVEDLAACARLGVDGVIVQDMGVLAVVREHFPSLTVHASTQMALGNAPGIREAARLGVRRIVLPRETPYESVVSLKKQHPDMEFEVFIHGALCYSYSGLCLASGLMGAGSGNRGACAQVCRLRFAHSSGESCLLSCRDLFTGPLVKRLAAARIDSLKIEGRLKPASYVYHTVRYYRFILDHDRPEDEPEYSDLLAQSGIVFSRERTPGRLFGGPEERLITSRYERSVGFPVGRVEGTDTGSFSFTAGVPIALGDVLQVFLNEHERVPFKLPVRKLSVSGVPVRRAERGELVTVASEKIPAIGVEITKVYSRDQELPGIRHKKFRAYGRSLPLRIVIDKQPPRQASFEAMDNRIPVFVHPCTCDKQERVADMKQRFSQSIAGMEIPFYRPTLSELVVAGPDSESGIGNRQWRKILAAFTQHVAAAEAAAVNGTCAAIHQANRSACPPACAEIEGLRFFLSNRANLNPPVEPQGLIPFYSDGPLNEHTLARQADAVFIPLHPVMHGAESGYSRGLDAFIRKNRGLTIYLGVNNLRHLEAVREWERLPHVRSFIDFFFYLANASAIRFVLSRLSRPVFGYFWIEGEEKDRIALEQKVNFPLLEVGPEFRPPYFFHAGDFFTESPGIQENGPHRYGDLRIHYRNFEFIIVMRDGFTYIFPVKN